MARFQHRIWNEWLTTFTSWWILYPSDDLDYLDDSFSMSSGLVFRFIDMFEMWALDVNFFFVDPRKNCASLSQYNCRTASIYRHPPAVPHSQTGLGPFLSEKNWWDEVGRWTEFHQTVLSVLIRNLSPKTTPITSSLMSGLPVDSTTTVVPWCATTIGTLCMHRVLNTRLHCTPFYSASAITCCCGSILSSPR